MTREQEIAEGLKRGELLAKLECGCVIIQDRTADAYIVYCSKHNATPPSVFKAAWLELAKCLGERMQQDELDLMDSILKSVELDMKKADEEEL